MDWVAKSELDLPGGLVETVVTAHLGVCGPLSLPLSAINGLSSISKSSSLSVMPSHDRHKFISNRHTG